VAPAIIMIDPACRPESICVLFLPEITYTGLQSPAVHGDEVAIVPRGH